MACNKIKEMLSYIIRDDMMRELRMRNKFLYAGFVSVHTWHKFYVRNIFNTMQKRCAEMEGQYEK